MSETFEISDQLNSAYHIWLPVWCPEPKATVSIFANVCNGSFQHTHGFIERPERLPIGLQHLCKHSSVAWLSALLSLCVSM